MMAWAALRTRADQVPPAFRVVATNGVLRVIVSQVTPSRLSKIQLETPCLMRGFKTRKFQKWALITSQSHYSIHQTLCKTARKVCSSCNKNLLLRKSKKLSSLWLLSEKIPKMSEKLPKIEKSGRTISRWDVHLRSTAKFKNESS